MIQCPMCEATDKTLGGIAKHIMVEHTFGGKAVQCPCCCKSTKVLPSEEWIAHYKKEHRKINAILYAKRLGITP